MTEDQSYVTWVTTVVAGKSTEGGAPEGYSIRSTDMLTTSGRKANEDEIQAIVDDVIAKWTQMFAKYEVGEQPGHVNVQISYMRAKSSS